MRAYAKYILLAVSLSTVWNQFAQAKDEICKGAFDVYFVIDKSSSLLKGNVNHFRDETVSFVTALSHKFVNPLLRMSYITFATTADVIMPLTSDRSIVETKLAELKQMIPDGPTLMHLGISKANNQISRLKDKRASIIIVLTDGKLEISTKVHAVTQANYARKLGSTLFVVGVSNYDERQLLEIAGGNSKSVFRAEDFSQLDRVVNEILLSSCVEVLSVDPDNVCSNQTFSMVVKGRGFNNTGITSLIKCNFWADHYTSVLVTPDEIDDEYLKCTSPTGFTLDNEEKITIQVSLNGGISFISSNVTVTAYVCKTTGAMLWLVIFILLLVILFAMWWLSNFLCCVSSPAKPQKEAPPPPPPPAQRPLPMEPPCGKTHWPAVDASRYGGAGVGGIKPVPVKWGDKGCTEAAMHLEKERGAKEVGFVRKKPGDIELDDNEPASPEQHKGCFGNAKKILAIVFAPFIIIYTALSRLKPTKEEVRNCILLRRRSEHPSEPKRGSYLDTAA